MPYNAKNVEVTKGLPSGVSADGLIKEIKDGKVGDFIHEKARDRWNTEQPAIEIVVEVTYEGKPYNFTKMFPYKEIEGKTTFGEKSDLGKYNKYYNKSPEAGDQIKAITNSDGYWRLLLE